MQIFCRKCGEPIKAQNVNVQAALAACDQCQAVFRIDSPDAGDAPSKPPVDLPKGFYVDPLPNRMTITYRWPRTMAIFLLLFAAFWDGFLVFWYTLAFTKANTPLIAKLFPIGHVAAGLVITYTGLAFLVNRTTIEATVQHLSVRYAPLPWPGAKRLDPATISQLYCEKYVSHRSNNVPQERYRVRVELMGGQRKHLVKGLTKPEHALFIEQELEKALGIQDRPVAGGLRV